MGYNSGDLLWLNMEIRSPVINWDLINGKQRLPT